MVDGQALERASEAGMSTRLRLALAGLLVPLVVLLDQWSKHLVLGDARFNAMECLNDSRLCGGIELSQIFDLRMVWNRGMSFGALQSEGVMRWILFAVTAIIAIGFSIWLYRAARWMTGLALALVIGGAIGNMIDRARFGAVVDFFDFSGLWFPYVFNIADAAISVGAVLLFLDQFLLARDEKRAG